MQEMEATEVAGQFVEGLDYPLGKAAIIRSAREANLDAKIVAALESIEDREYTDADDLARAMAA
jgi:hypothetical protein